MLEVMLTQYKGTLIVVSHDRDFLDQTVSKILAFEGDGEVEGVIGGYSDYLEKVKSKEPKVIAVKKEKPKPVEAPAPEPKSTVKKLTFKLQHELDTLPAKINELEEEIETLGKKLDDVDFYARDADGFLKASQGLEKAKVALAAAESRWLELEAMRDAI